MVLPRIKLTHENLALTGILVILVAIPLTVILLGVRQELRKGARVETQGLVVFVATFFRGPKINKTRVGKYFQ